MHSSAAEYLLDLSAPCSTTLATVVSRYHAAPRFFKNIVTGLVSRLSVGPLEIPFLGMEQCASATSTVDTRLVSPSARALALTRVPARVHVNRPLEVELAAAGLCPSVDAAESVASWISAHAILQISVEEPGQPRGEVSLLVKARPSGDGGWITRALSRPAAWADAASITVVSLSLAGRPLPCDFLPAILAVGYNHAPAQAGVVCEAAQAGDVPALQAALDAGGSTEEADEVRGYKQTGGRQQ